MNKTQQLDKLRQIAALLFDARLARLKALALAKLETEGHLADLAGAPVHAPSLSEIAIEGVSLRYERWADARRAELNLKLARQTADWLDAQGAARLAFGKTQALDGLHAKILETSTTKSV